MRGLSENRRHLGPPATVPHVRPRRLLRFVQEQACDEALPGRTSPDRPVVGAGRGLALVLRGRNLHRAGRLTSEAWPELPLAAWAETRHPLRPRPQLVGNVQLVQPPESTHP